MIVEKKDVTAFQLKVANNECCISSVKICSSDFCRYRKLSFPTKFTQERSRSKLQMGAKKKIYMLTFPT
jgi:hypothetical protein